MARAMAKGNTRWGMMKGSSMTDKSKSKAPPKVGPDDNEKTRIASTGSSVAPKMADRDGPSKGNTNKMVQKPATSHGKGAPQIKPGMRNSATGKQPGSGMPSASVIASMKKSLSGGGTFKR